MFTENKMHTSKPAHQTIVVQGLYTGFTWYVQSSYYLSQHLINIVLYC